MISRTQTKSWKPPSMPPESPCISRIPQRRTLNGSAQFGTVRGLSRKCRSSLFPKIQRNSKQRNAMLLLPFKTMETSRDSRKQNLHTPGLFFRCRDCGIAKPVPRDGCGTGYATTGRSPKARFVCYGCCAIQDRKHMERDGKSVLYLSERSPLQWEISNWPGTLRFNASVSTSWHNFAGRNGRRDAWFMGPDGKQWHAVSIGWRQVARCKRVK